jgi:hypothetical protein
MTFAWIRSVQIGFHDITSFGLVEPVHARNLSEMIFVGIENRMVVDHQHVDLLLELEVQTVFR